MRTIMKGFIGFGLVNIPVEVYTGSQSSEIKFNLLHSRDLSEIKYARICKEEDVEVPWNEIVKGYKTESGAYVVMSDEELKKATSERTKSIEITQFVEEDEIDTIFYEKPYIVIPDKGADKAYGLLHEVLKKSKKVGIAKYVLHNREHIGAVKTYKNFILLNQLRYPHELVNIEDLKKPASQTIPAKEMDIAMKLINHMAAPFKPEQFKDTYIEEVKEILKQKEKGIKPTKKAAPAPSKKIHDIMSLLKASLEEKDKKPAKSKKKAQTAA